MTQSYLQYLAIVQPSSPTPQYTWYPSDRVNKYILWGNLLQHDWELSVGGYSFLWKNSFSTLLEEFPYL